MIKTIFFLALAVAFVAGSIATGTIAFADDSDGTVFYTLFDQTNPFNVKSVDFSYVSGANSLTLMNKVDIAHTVDADGIVVNPQDTSKLIVGTGFSQSLEVVTIVGGAIVSQASPVDAFHLELIDANTIATTAIPGEMATHPIAGDGSIGAGTMITISGDDDVITQLIAVPGGSFFYTSSNFLGTGSYGELTFGGGNTATTSRIHSDLPAAHGGEYDPFSDTVIIVGSNHITQIDVNDDSILCDLEGGVDFTEPAGFDHFDQDIVDGAGHLIIADNGGNLFFVDYPSGDLCDGTTKITSSFLDISLDDIAPFIMPPGGDEGCTPGYWKANAKFKKDPANAWTVEDPDDTLDDAGFSPQLQDVSTELLDALKLNGGKDAAGMERNLLRQCVAAKLNAENPNVAYAITNSNEVIQVCNEAMATEDRDTMEELKDLLDEFNNAGCSINMKGEPEQ